MSAYNLIVIGSGPGGYTGAIRAAQLGLKTAVVEKDKNLGGTCLNVGCIPSKALLDSSEHYHFAKEEMIHHGVKTSSVSLDLTTMMNRKSKIVKELTGGIQYLLKKNKIDRFEGVGSFLSPQKIQIKNGSKTQVIEGKNIILATGSIPNDLPGIPFDGKKVISSTEALSLNKVPKTLLIVGGGYIGLEMASVWSRLGTEVVVLEYADRLCPTMDQELSKNILKVLQKQKIKFLLESQVQEIKTTKKEVELFYKSKTGDKLSLKGDHVLLAVGRRPYTKNLNLEKAHIQTDERGFVQVDSKWRTSHSHIFAIGDLIGGAMLAHKAEEEGVAVAEIIAGQAGHVHYETVPSVIYTWPEVASVGKTEEQLIKENIPYKSGKFPFTANGRAKALGFTEGFVKILANTNTDLILGVHILGPRASDMIAEAVVAMELGASSEDLARSFHAHPTLSEVMREAALNVDKRARQI
ncbi:MAG: dihydrolipoyl dehydrogenase [Bdellovibrionales bacterium]|nr:dihydrolipoyl dehydrogenase [Bdellovibrionales bacterium]